MKQEQDVKSNRSRRSSFIQMRRANCGMGQFVFHPKHTMVSETERTAKMSTLTCLPLYIMSGSVVDEEKERTQMRNVAAALAERRLLGGKSNKVACVGSHVCWRPMN